LKNVHPERSRRVDELNELTVKMAPFDVFYGPSLFSLLIIKKRALFSFFSLERGMSRSDRVREKGGRTN
jgi:hypothetical protein